MQIKKSLMSVLIAGAMVALPQTALAGWTLDNQNSALSFVSVKNSAVTEVHQFKNLSGLIDDKGLVMVDIDLASVDTKIEIRDQRMKDMLFNVDNYPEANLSAQINIEQLVTLKPGQSMVMPIDLELALHDKTQKIKTTVSVVVLEEGALQVTTIEPVVIYANQFGLEDGVKALQEVAKLNAIALGVPVNAQFVFKPE
ncbi:hypothetical protein A1QC_09690 [Vibrio rumoiensis 1S-45]|uniref:Lipid/polyisoprenoid-binding YceI-like domain-containing protein n=1 Tax=Vibrio rumoiensis 1S-45 TaxID=1188252 RepID=A0A1E5E1P2_9VIBR|nr:hypothetical protein A1QC_09690 [Vibrio rumoiensis 1S-45]